MTLSVGGTRVARGLRARVKGECHSVLATVARAETKLAQEREGRYQSLGRASAVCLVESRSK